MDTIHCESVFLINTSYEKDRKIFDSDATKIISRNDDESQYNESQDSGSQDSESQDSESQDSESQDSESQDSESIDEGAMDDEYQDNDVSEFIAGIGSLIRIAYTEFYINAFC